MMADPIMTYEKVEAEARKEMGKTLAEASKLQQEAIAPFEALFRNKEISYMELLKKKQAPYAAYRASESEAQEAYDAARRPFYKAYVTAMIAAGRRGELDPYGDPDYCGCSTPECCPDRCADYRKEMGEEE